MARSRAGATPAKDKRLRPWQDDPEHPEVRAAWISAVVGGLIVAVISAGVSGLTVRSQIRSQEQTVQSQLAAQQQLEATKFLREQRVSAYSGLVNAYEEYTTAYAQIDTTDA